MMILLILVLLAISTLIYIIYLITQAQSIVNLMISDLSVFLVDFNGVFNDE